MASSKLSPLDKAFARRPSWAFLRRFGSSTGPFRRFPLVQGLVNVPACLPARCQISSSTGNSRWPCPRPCNLEVDLISIVEGRLPGFVPFACVSLVLLAPPRLSIQEEIGAYVPLPWLTAGSFGMGSFLRAARAATVPRHQIRRERGFRKGSLLISPASRKRCRRDLDQKSSMIILRRKLLIHVGDCNARVCV